ncbi:MAG: prepilin-type N-terminal cleavage/methylation domain-containing protein [Oscillospiraceae bacterium]|nr:prepilin-type N-terminal cleavage/methylation domain-containing protein [Oscillospiraceae bacterium]
MKRKVKGFTLIELIVVLATFSIIMFGAMQLIQPVTKMMVQSEVYEGGNAAVTSISTYLENSLSTAEYLKVYDGLLTGTALDDEVADFVDTRYGGVLAAGSTTSSATYGEGQIHVLQIDNTANGKISSYVYNVNFDPSAATIVGSPTYTEWAVNKAYYDDYSFEIKPGIYTSVPEFDTTVPTAADVMANLSAKSTSFTIKAATTRNNTDYSFLTSSTMSLVNIYNNHGAAVSGLYYVIAHLENPTTHVWETKIADRAAANIYLDNGVTPYPTILSALDVSLTSMSTDAYTFIYSYGAEIDTQ